MVVCIRLSHQCELEFMKMAHVWYKVLVLRILFSKNVKVRQRLLCWNLDSLSKGHPLNCSSTMLYSGTSLI